jgi:hypothetical protein
MVMRTIESINEIYKDFTLSTSKGKRFYFFLEEKNPRKQRFTANSRMWDSLTRLLLGWLLAGRYGSQSYIH